MNSIGRLSSRAAASIRRWHVGQLLMLWVVAALVMPVVWRQRTQVRRAVDTAWFVRDSSVLAAALRDSATKTAEEQAIASHETDLYSQYLKEIVYPKPDSIRQAWAIRQALLDIRTRRLARLTWVPLAALSVLFVTTWIWFGGRVRERKVDL